jgi:iron(III) transport system permease protein
MSFINSAILACGAVAIALPIGALLAVLITKFRMPGGRVAAGCLGVLLFLPLYVQLCGWDAALGRLGWYSLWYGSIAQPLLAGLPGAIFVHGVAAIPWAALLVGLGLTQVESAEEEAALLVAPPRVVLWRLTLPRAIPFLLAAAIWTAVSTTSDMTVTNIYLINPREQTYTERFYMTLALSGDASQAAVSVLPGIAALVAIAGATLWMAGQLCSRKVAAIVSQRVRFPLGNWRIGAATMLWLVVGLLIGVPILSLVTKAGFVVLHEGGERIPSWSVMACLRQIATAPQRFAREFVGTLVVASGAASGAVAVAMGLAWRARRGGWLAAPALVTVAICLAIPGPLIGATLIQILNHDLPPALLGFDGTRKSWLLLLYDATPLAPMLAQAIRALPLAIMLLWHSFATLSDDVLDAAALAGLRPLQVFWQIAVRQRRQQILAAWIAAFAVAAGDLAWAHLVTPPGLDLLSRRVFGLVHSGVEEQVAAISLVVVLVYAIICLLLLRLLTLGRASSRSFD